MFDQSYIYVITGTTTTMTYFLHCSSTVVCVQCCTHTLKGLLVEGMVWDSVYSFPLFAGLGGLEQRHNLDLKK